MTRRIRLVVLNHDGGDLVLRCLEHLAAVRWRDGEVEVVVVDNASGDGSAERIARAHPTAALIRSPANTGFSANNLGLADLDGIDYVGLVNPDAFVPPDLLDQLAAALDCDPGLGAACPLIVFDHRYQELGLEAEPAERLLAGTAVDGSPVDRHVLVADGWEVPDGGADPRPRLPAGRRGLLRVPVVAGGATATVRLEVVGAAEQVHELALRPDAAVDVVQNAGSRLLPGLFGADRGYGEPVGPAHAEDREVFAWCGAAVLLRPAYLADVGCFDPRLFLYYEDLDLSWRGQGRGWRTRYVAATTVRHLHAGSTVAGSKVFVHHNHRSRLLVLAMDAPAGVALGAVGRFVLATASYLRRDVLARVVRGRRPHLHTTAARLTALASFLLAAPGAIRRRRARRTWSVGDDELLGWARVESKPAR